MTDLPFLGEGERNFQLWLEAQRRFSPDGDAKSFSGPWGVVLSGGVTFTTKYEGSYVCTFFSSGFVTTNVNLTIDVYVDSVKIGTMISTTTNAVNIRLQTSPAIAKLTLKPGVHVVQYLSISGTSDASDKGAFTIARIA